MDSVNKIIDNIKRLSEGNVVDISSQIMNNFFLEIERLFYNKKDIELLVDLVLQNIDISTNVLSNIFINSRNKTEYTVLVSIDKNEKLNQNKFVNEKQILEFLNAFGTITIFPEKIKLLWNEKVDIDPPENVEKINFNYKRLVDNDGKLIDFVDVNSKFTNNYKRIFGLQEYNNNFFYGKWQLTVDINNVKLFTSLISEYSGDIQTMISGNILNFTLKSENDIEKIINDNKKNLLNEMIKHPKKTLSYSNAFFENRLLQKNNDLFFDAITKKISKFKLPKLDTYQNVEKYKFNTTIEVIREFECEHISVYNNIFKNENYFDDVNNFINNYINYKEGRAICVLCGESVIGLNIQATFFNNSEVNNIALLENILSSPPYNKFINLNFFIDSLINEYIYITKVGVSNSVTLARMLVDNLLEINSNRTNLEITYTEDIAADRIFFLRLSNNFFDAYDFEKERYKEKRLIFTNIPAYLLILTTASLNDFYDLFFLKKTIKIKKINSDISQITFEDAVTYIINFVLKKVVVNYSETDDKKNLSNLRRTIEIYKEIFNQEFKIIFNQKKIIFERYIKKLSLEEKLFSWDVVAENIRSPYSEYDDIGIYTKNVFVADFLRPGVELDYYKKRIKRFENITVYKNTNTKTDNYIVESTSFDKKNKILNIDFFSDPSLSEKDIEKVNETMSEFAKEKLYTYNDNTYSIYNYENVYVLENIDKNIPSINFLDTSLLNIKSKNKYTYPILVDGDEFLYIKNIKNYHFERIMTKFFSIIYKLYKVKINSNLAKFAYSDQMITRQLLFSCKCAIINMCL